MRNVLAIAGRELRSIFTSPVAYVVLTGFLLLGGWFFFNLVARFNMLVQMYSSFQGAGDTAERLNLNDFVVAPLLHNLAVVLLIVVPMITMRSFAEEKRLGTYELLLTSPVGTGQIVLGKLLATGAFVGLMVAGSGIFGVILAIWGNPEIQVLVSGYVGLLLVGLTFVAIGLFASSLTENQIIAAVVGLVMTLLLFVIAWPADTAGDILGPVLRHLAVTEHFDTMVRGIVSTSTLVYFGTMVAGWAFLTQRSVESIRWR